MAAGHGGARRGAGRRAGGRSEGTEPSRFDDALAYLAAVVRGEEPADGLRIAAAKAVLPYQQPKRRAPVASPPPSALRAATEREADAAVHGDWKDKAAAVRARLAAKKEKKQ